MSRPSVCVFDLGKVLVDFDYSISARKIAARSRPGIDTQRIWDDHAPILQRYETGSIDTAGFYEAIRAATGFTGTAAEFSELFADIFTGIPGTIALHAELRRKQFPTFIFSNTNPLAVDHIRRSFPFFRDFDGYILSYEHGAMKPEAKLYEAVERETKRRGAEILYLDDRPENIAAGSARGWRTVLHETPERTRRELVQLGLL